MQNNGILPDTCAWIDYFRPGAAPLGQALHEALAGSIVYVCGPVNYELFQGAKSAKERALLTSAFGALRYLEMDKALWIKAGQLSANLRKEGQTIPFSDILLATLAIEHRLAVLTLDAHFRNIPGLALHDSGLDRLPA